MSKATKTLKLNTRQLWLLRNTPPHGKIGCDRSSGKALVARGFAVEHDQRRNGGTGFWITIEGFMRAKYAADVIAYDDTTGMNHAPLMKDLP
jgi:hypothetical protein